MSTYQLGVRKNVENEKSLYWLLINATIARGEDEDYSSRGRYSKTVFAEEIQAFRSNCIWKLFIALTILLNVLITINYFAFDMKNNFVFWVIVAHVTCIIYWIDVILFLIISFSKENKRSVTKIKILTLIIDIISLLPFSAIYLMAEPNPDWILFFSFRSITLLRFYRIPSFFTRFATSGSQSLQAFIISSVIYALLSVNIFATLYVWSLPEGTTFDIKDWNATIQNTMIVALYFSFTTQVNLGLGDIVPTTYFQTILSIAGMIVGFSMMTGVLTGAITTHLAYRQIRRELYRNQRAVTMNTLKQIKIEKRVLEKLSGHLSTTWKCKRGYLGTPQIDLLPKSMQKEILFDINFTLLNRSLIFSMQTRSFLRSTCLKMKNWSFLPGEVIMEPFGMPDVMLCIASGVVEIVSEENRETVLFSLREGSILGEAKLFLSTPTPCTIRASTYVEIQALATTNFTRLALKFPDIYRLMREEIQFRINSTKLIRNADDRNLELTRKVSLRNFLNELRNSEKYPEHESYDNALKRKILKLYVISENIPHVKLLPVELIQKAPWILRPNTPFINCWKFLIFITVVIVVTTYPILASFVRVLEKPGYILLYSVQVMFVVDLIIQCLTAIERDDNYTYVTSVKKIVVSKLKTIGFYVDILATLDLTAYTSLLLPSQPDYSCLILAQNKNLKFWYIYHYFNEIENKLEYNLIWVRVLKYLFYICVSIIWSAAILHWEACPGEQCREERWLAWLERKKVADLDPIPVTEWPSIVCFYFATILLIGVGYGDIVAKSIADCFAIILVMVAGAALGSFILAETATTANFTEISKSEYQTEIFAVDRFMREHEIPENLHRQTQDYLQLQWNYDRGFSVKHNSIKKKLTPQEREIIIKEVTQSILSVPLFQDTNSNFIRILAKSANIRLLPPNQLIVKTGNYGQPMYILQRGYCEVTINDSQYVIGPITPFGYVEMILGIPVDIKVQTLTHCRIIALTYSTYLVAITKHPSVKDQIDEKIQTDQSVLKDLSNSVMDIRHQNMGQTDVVTFGKQKQSLTQNVINVHKYRSTEGLSYWEPFREWGKFQFLQFLLLPFVVTPHSLFLKIWMSIRITSALLVGLLSPIHFSIPIHTTPFYQVIIILQIFACIDMYLMFHVAYYDERGILIFHPAKTAIYYLKGSFVLDLISVIPFYEILDAIFPSSGYTTTRSLFYKTPGLIMVLQCYKFSQACYYLESDILRQAENIRIFKFLPLTLIIANLINGIVIILECSIYSPKILDDFSPMEKEFHEGVSFYCVESVSNSTKTVSVSPIKFYIISYYWVMQTLTSCGFGDIRAHDGPSMVAIIIITLIGMFLFCYMFSNLTSCALSVHLMVTQYRSRILEMTKFMKDKNVKASTQKRLILHYTYNWQRTKGENPEIMFTYLNSRLRLNVLSSLYGHIVEQVPAFQELQDVIIQIIGKQLKEIYFLRGETIIKHNDKQQHIYLIYTGAVEVTDNTGGLITTMGIGGLFGNISNKPFSLSSVAIIAIENLDVLELNTESFFAALQDYPKAKQLIQYLTSTTKDYIEPSNEGIKKVSFTQSKEDTLPFEMEIDGRGPRPSTDLGSLYFSNSIFRSKKPKKTCLILPESRFDTFLGVTYVILSYLSCVVTLYHFAYQHHSLSIFFAVYILDVLFYLKIFLQFHMSYFDKSRNYVINKKKIRTRYLKSKRILSFDIVANVPLEVFVFAAPSEFMSDVLSVLRLNRLLRIIYILDFYKEKFKVLMINKIYLELSRILVFISLMIHAFACIWYFVACPLGRCIETSWISSVPLKRPEDKWTLYLISCYYVIYTSTTTGYGNIQIRTLPELIISIVIMVTSRFFLVLMAGSVGAVINAHRVHIFQYQDKIEELKNTFLRQKISEHQLSKMWNYVTSLWLNEKGKQIPEFITMAPYSLKCDVMNAMFGNHLTQSAIFYNLSDDFIRQLAICLERYVYFPGNYIVQQGDIDHTMYFIHKGQFQY